MHDHGIWFLMGVLAKSVRPSASAVVHASIAARRGAHYVASALAVLCLGAFLHLPAAHAQEARIEKEYTGTLTGSIQAHPENDKYPYWLKCDTSTYGIVIGNNAKAKAVLDEFSGTRISLDGTIQEFADGGLVIVPDLPIKRPARNPALALVRKAFTHSITTIYSYPRIIEEILLENGEDVFIFCRQSKKDGTLHYEIYSVKNGALTYMESSCPIAPFGAWKHWISVSTDNDRLKIVFLRSFAGRGITETWIYDHGQLYEVHVVSADGECIRVPYDSFRASIRGSIYRLNDCYWLKSADTLYGIYPCVMETGKKEAWFSERIGNWVTLTGKVSGGDYEPIITPDTPTQEQQSSAAVSVAGKSVMYGGKAIFTAPDAASLYLQEELVLSNGDDVFIIGMNTGNKVHPHLYKIFSVQNGVCTAKDAMGNGDGNPIVTLTDDKDAVTITFYRFNPGKGLTEAWTYKDGAVSKAQAEATSRP